MKKILTLGLLLIGILSFSVAYARYTHSYIRKDGTPVKGYYSYHPLDGTGSYVPDTKFEKLNSSNSTETPVCVDNINGFQSTDGNCYCNLGYSWSSIQNRCSIDRTNIPNKPNAEILTISTDISKCSNNMYFDGAKNSCVSKNYVCVLMGGPRAVYQDKTGGCDCRGNYHWDDSAPNETCIKNTSN